MLKDIGNIIISFLEPLVIGGSGINPFVDVMAGVVKVITKTDLDRNNKPINRYYPVACGLSLDDCISNGRYQDLIPDSKKGCIIYLEDISNNFIRQNGTKKEWSARFRLVGWINQKELGYDDCSITSQIISTIIALFPQNKLYNSGIFQMFSINVLGQDPTNYNPFSKFSYEEDKIQYLMYPYDYFSIQLEFNYSIDDSCIPSFIKKPKIDC